MRLLSSIIVILGVRSMNVNRQHYMSLMSLKMKKEYPELKKPFPLYQPKTENQNKYVKYLTEKKNKCSVCNRTCRNRKNLISL